MAVKQYSRRISLKITFVVFISWLCLMIWCLSQWGMHDYTDTVKRLTALINIQKQILRPVSKGSLLSALPIDANINASFKPPYVTQIPYNPFTVALVNKFKQFITLVLLSSQLMLIKLMIVLAATPLFILAVIVGLVDGLSQRAIRTACLGRESSYVFHKLNHYLKRGLIGFLIIWLAVPLALQPSLAFVPIGLLLSLMVTMTTSRFKKYL
jgi:hypothetical protein